MLIHSQQIEYYI